MWVWVNMGTLSKIGGITSRKEKTQPFFVLPFLPRLLKATLPFGIHKVPIVAKQLDWQEHI